MTGKRYYMHTIYGRPAFYDKASGQIVLAELRDDWEDDYPLVVVRETVDQIRDDQRKTRRFRESMGWNEVGKYDYVILSLEPGLIPWHSGELPKGKASAIRRRRATIRGEA